MTAKRAVRVSVAPQPTEAQIQEACSEFLALDSWRRIRTDLKQLRGMGVQEKGMADDLFIRYTPRNQGHPPSRIPSGVAEVIWIEWKSKKGIHGQKQEEWQRAERARGALVWVSKQDFPATIEGFMEFYRSSGLARHV